MRKQGLQITCDLDHILQGLSWCLQAEGTSYPTVSWTGTKSNCWTVRNECVCVSVCAGWWPLCKGGGILVLINVCFIMRVCYYVDCPLKSNLMLLLGAVSPSCTDPVLVVQLTCIRYGFKHHLCCKCKQRKYLKTQATVELAAPGSAWGHGRG